MHSFQWFESSPFDFWFDADNLGNIPLCCQQSRFVEQIQIQSSLLLRRNFVVLSFCFMRKNVKLVNLETETWISYPNRKRDGCFYWQCIYLFSSSFEKCESKPTQCHWWNAFFKFQLIEFLAGLDEMRHKLQLWVNKEKCAPKRRRRKCHCTQFRTFDERWNTRQNNKMLTWDGNREIHANAKSSIAICRKFAADYSWLCDLADCNYYGNTVWQFQQCE